MAEQQFAVVISEVHAVAFAVAPVLAVFAVIRFHPLVIAMWLEAMFPNIHEIVLVDIALLVVVADACAGTDAAIHEHRSHRYACCAAEHPVANVSFVCSEEAFASVGSVYLAFLTSLADEVEQSSELFSRELQIFVLSPSANGEDGGKSPIRDAFVDEVRFELRQGVVVVLMHAGHHVVNECRVAHYHVDGLACHAEAVGVAPQPGVLFFQSVEADCYRAESGIFQFVEHLRREKESVCHHSPGEAASRDASGTFHNVLSYKGFSASEDNEDFVRIALCGNVVQHSEEVFPGHIGSRSHLSAIASAMSAMDIAADSTLPEHLPERMFVLEALVQQPIHLERHLSAKT